MPGPYGLTPAGFVLKTFEDIEAEVTAYQRKKISKHLKLNEKTALGNINKSLCEQLAAAWEVLQAAAHASDPANADDDSFVALAELTGTKRRGATKGSVPAICTFTAGKTYAAGALVAHVAGQPSNRWVNRDAVTTGSGGALSVVFVSETAGAHAVANAGTLTVIAQPIDGWVSVTNEVDATPGQDIESIEDLAVRREQELQRAGSRTLHAIRSSVSAVPGVISVYAEQNTEDYPANGLPPHSYRIVVWDGVAGDADNDAIAQAIFDRGADGVKSAGSISGTAIDPDDGSTVIVKFDRATQKNVWVSITVFGTVTEDAVKNAILAAAPQRPGEDVIALRVRSAPLALAGVVDVTEFAIGFTSSPIASFNLTVEADAIAVFDGSRINVTII